MKATTVKAIPYCARYIVIVIHALRKMDVFHPQVLRDDAIQYGIDISGDDPIDPISPTSQY